MNAVAANGLELFWIPVTDTVIWCMMEPMQDDMVVPPYQAGDRAKVREICLATADRGRPLTVGGLDGELVADLVTRYYTDIDSRWSWMAEEKGTVVGYSKAAVDTRTFRRAMTWRIVPGAVIRGVGEEGAEGY